MAKAKAKTKPSKMGRPSKLTPALTKKVCELVSEGALEKAAAEEVEVSYRTFARWCADGERWAKRHEVRVGDELPEKAPPTAHFWQGIARARRLRPGSLNAQLVRIGFGDVAATDGQVRALNFALRHLTAKEELQLKSQRQAAELGLLAEQKRKAKADADIAAAKAEALGDNEGLAGLLLAGDIFGHLTPETLALVKAELKNKGVGVTGAKDLAGDVSAEDVARFSASGGE